MDGGLSAFTIEPDGSLTPLVNLTDSNLLPLAGAARLTEVTVADEQYLLVPSFARNAIGAYLLGTDGVPGSIGTLVDDDVLNLDGVFPLAIAEAGEITYLIAGGFEDNGLSVFELFDTIPALESELVFTGQENSPADTVFGDVDAVIGSGDTDVGVSYAILSGNTDVDGDGTPPFALDTDTGRLTVLDGGDLDFETTPSFSIDFEAFNTVTEDARTDTLTVLLLDGDDVPVRRDDAVAVEEDGTVTGNLFDDNGNGPDIDDSDFILTEIAGTAISEETILTLPSGALLTIAPDGSFTYDTAGVYSALRDGETQIETLIYRVDDEVSGTDTATLSVTVMGEDARISIDTLSDPLPEGDLDGTAFDFLVRRTGQTDSRVTLKYAVVPSAISTVDGDDFDGGVLPGGSVTLLPGVREATVSIRVSGDFLFETDESLRVELSQVSADSGVAILEDEAAEAIVLNDDASPTRPGTNGKDKVKGTDSVQVIDALDGDDRLKLAGGDDIAFGGAGNDRMQGQDGDDTLIGDAGDDRISGGNGNDILRGGLGEDRIKGGNGNDLISGDGGADRIDGGAGDDLLRGGAGSDILKGGKGTDTFVFSSGDEEVLVRDFDPEEDILNLTGVGRDIVSFAALLTFADQDGKDLVFNFGGGEVLTLRRTDIDELDSGMVLI